MFNCGVLYFLTPLILPRVDQGVTGRKDRREEWYFHS